MLARAGLTAADPSSSRRRAHSPSVAPAPPQLLKKVKTRRSPVQSALPKIDKKASASTAPLQFEDAPRDVRRRQPNAPPQAPSSAPALTSVGNVVSSHPWPYGSYDLGRQLPPPPLLSGPALPSATSSTPFGYPSYAPLSSGVPLAPSPSHWPQPDLSGSAI